MLGKIALFFSAVMATLAWLLYTPSIPYEVEDRYRNMLYAGTLKMAMVHQSKVREFFGYSGKFLDSLRGLQEPIYTTGWTKSEWQGILNVTRIMIDGVPVILYQPKEMSGLYPAAIYMHGGGFVLASADTHDWTAHDYAVCLGAVVFNVNYRLAPQHPYPSALEDVLKVVTHVLTHGNMYGVDVTKVGVMGASAGANLATSAALKLKDAKVTGSKLNLPALSFQALMHPTVQAFDLRLPSYIDYANNSPYVTAAVMATFDALYLGLDEKKGEYASKVITENRHVCPELRENATISKYLDVANLPERFRTPKRKIAPVDEPCERQIFNQIKDKIIDPFMSPLMAPDLSGLPPAIVTVSEFDILRDEGILYAHRLKEAGVTTELAIFKGIHDDMTKLFPSWLTSRTGLENDRAVCGFVNKVLGKNQL